MKNIKLKDDYYTDSNFYRDNYKINSFLTPINGQLTFNIFQNGLIKPNINSNQTSYLKNDNDYDIKENYTKNDDRSIKYDLKKKPYFDTVNNIRKNLNPVEVTLDKWPHFYER
jgi:hypothetical protein